GLFRVRSLQRARPACRTGIQSRLSGGRKWYLAPFRRFRDQRANAGHARAPRSGGGSSRSRAARRRLRSAKRVSRSSTRRECPRNANEKRADGGRISRNRQDQSGGRFGNAARYFAGCSRRHTHTDDAIKRDLSAQRCPSPPRARLWQHSGSARLRLQPFETPPRKTSRRYGATAGKIDTAMKPKFAFATLLLFVTTSPSFSGSLSAGPAMTLDEV